MAVLLHEKFIIDMSTIDKAITFVRAAMRFKTNVMETQIERDRLAIERLMNYMNDHCTEPFNARKHAGVIYFSESKLNKVFKTYAGIGPGAYFRRLRIQKAMELYQSGVRNWTEVSHIVGYADLPSFSKAFKKITGSSPNSFHA